MIFIRCEFKNWQRRNDLVLNSGGGAMTENKVIRGQTV